MNMDCRHIQRKIWDYTEGKLSGSDISAVEEHLGKCSYCSRFASHFATAMHLLDSQRSRYANPYTYSKVMLRLQETPSGHKGSKYLMNRLLPLAAVLFTGLFTGIMLVKYAADFPRSAHDTGYTSEQQTDFFSVSEMDSTVYSAYFQYDNKSIR